MRREKNLNYCRRRARFPHQYLSYSVSFYFSLSDSLNSAVSGNNQNFPLCSIELPLPTHLFPSSHPSEHIHCHGTLLFAEAIMRFQSAISFILFSAVTGFTPTTLSGGWNQGKASSATTRAEPSFTEKFGRRLNVYWLASRVFFDYKQAQRKESRLKRKLGIAEDSDSDDDPSVTLLWNNIHERNAAKLTKKIVNLEGFWIKVGQYLSSRSDVMPFEYITRLTSLQDSMPPKAFEDVMLTLHEEFTEEEMLLLHYIDPLPLSTASLAQVHRATLKNGRQVVLKVQHRGVASLMLQDMENLKSILNMVAKFEPDSDFTSIIQEYNKEVRKELDFRTEAENMNEVRKLLQEQNIRAIVPDVVPELVKERVLVMDFCEGFTIRDLDALDSHGVDRELLLKRVCDSWAAQMHVGGVFNADPHPGNILVSTSEIDGDASVPVLLDFGLTKRLETDAKLAFAKLMHASDETDVDALLQSFEEMGLEMNRYDPFEDMSAMQVRSCYCYDRVVHVIMICFSLSYSCL
jgi:aarF domain-containing kinase